MICWALFYYLDKDFYSGWQIKITIDKGENEQICCLCEWGVLAAYIYIFFKMYVDNNSHNGEFRERRCYPCSIWIKKRNWWQSIKEPATTILGKTRNWKHLNWLNVNTELVVTQINKGDYRKAITPWTWPIFGGDSVHFSNGLGLATE